VIRSYLDLPLVAGRAAVGDRVAKGAVSLIPEASDNTGSKGNTT
jgi:hypothetical protein